MIGNQKNTINFTTDDLKDVSSSRTFCLYEDIEKIKKAGLQRWITRKCSGSGSKKVLNKDGLRNNKEFVNPRYLI